MIVVFGSINVDLVMTVARLPRPGETVLTQGYRAVAGGKGANQALAAARAGGRVRMVGCVGRDGFAAPALGNLRAAGVDLSGVVEVDLPTGCAVVCVDGEGENQIVVAAGANLKAAARQVPESVLGPDTTLLVQLEVDEAENRLVIARARDAGARIVLNAAPARRQPGAVLAALDVLVVNAVEAAMLAEHASPGAIDGQAAARVLATAYGVVVIVTLGGEGAVAFAPDGAWSVPALTVAAVDTTGAGDAFTGVLAAALDGGAALTDALRRASVAAGLSCLAAGAQPALPGAAEIERRLAEIAPPRPLS